MAVATAIFYIISTATTSSTPSLDTLNLTSYPANGIPYTLCGSL